VGLLMVGLAAANGAGALAPVAVPGGVVGTFARSCSSFEPCDLGVEVVAGIATPACYVSSGVAVGVPGVLRVSAGRDQIYLGPGFEAHNVDHPEATFVGIVCLLPFFVAGTGVLSW
jgi:hypothetical protein